MLKQYGSFGTRTPLVHDLKRLLGLEGQCKQFALFKLRVLFFVALNPIAGGSRHKRIQEHVP